MKTMLLMGDLTAGSRVALRMLTALLEERGHEVLQLPTALISNIFSLGAHAETDTSEYCFRTLETWKTLGIRWDAAYIGYITGMPQAQRLARFAQEQREQGRIVVVDPILGDAGKRYLSVTDGQLEGMRLLAAHADVITPNETEAALLLGKEPGTDAAALCTELRERFGCAAVITGASLSDGTPAVLCCGKDGKLSRVTYEKVPGRFGGTGDFFSGVLLERLAEGDVLETAVRAACLQTTAALRSGNRLFLPLGE